MGAVVTEGEVRAGGPMTVELPMVPTRSSIAYDGPSATTGESDAAPHGQGHSVELGVQSWTNRAATP